MEKDTFAAVMSAHTAGFHGIQKQVLSFPGLRQLGMKMHARFAARKLGVNAPGKMPAALGSISEAKSAVRGSDDRADSLDEVLDTSSVGQVDDFDSDSEGESPKAGARNINMAIAAASNVEEVRENDFFPLHGPSNRLHCSRKLTTSRRPGKS